MTQSTEKTRTAVHVDSLGGSNRSAILLQQDGNTVREIFYPASTGDDSKDKALLQKIYAQATNWKENGVIPRSPHVGPTGLTN